LILELFELLDMRAKNLIALVGHIILDHDGVVLDSRLHLAKRSVRFINIFECLFQLGRRRRGDEAILAHVLVFWRKNGRKLLRRRQRRIRFDIHRNVVRNDVGDVADRGACRRRDAADVAVVLVTAAHPFFLLSRLCFSLLAGGRWRWAMGDQ
jgi:hypothetical protein